MHDPATADTTVDVEQTRDGQSTEVTTNNGSDAASTVPSTPSHSNSQRSPEDSHLRRGHHRHHRHRRHHHRRHRHNRRSGELRYEKTLLHFSAAHILLGIICVLIQMVQFTNHSILSEAQPGLWCGTFFVITGSVCLGLAKTKGLYSTVTMLCFCLVSLFMALTLASLSWFGAEAAACCQQYWNDNCPVSKEPSWNISLPKPPTRELHPTSTEFFYLTAVAENSTISTGTCYEKVEDENLARCIEGYCGYDIGLGRTLHLMLLLGGVIGATISFVLSTLACSRPNGEVARRRPRISSIFAISGGDHIPTGGRPITAWEFPPPTKDVELANTPGIGEQYPDEPPPPYIEQDNYELHSHL